MPRYMIIRATLVVKMPDLTGDSEDDVTPHAIQGRIADVIEQECGYCDGVMRGGVKVVLHIDSIHERNPFA